jgi:hypothetical protein
LLFGKIFISIFSFIKVTEMVHAISSLPLVLEHHFRFFPWGSTHQKQTEQQGRETTPDVNCTSFHTAVFYLLINKHILGLIKESGNRNQQSTSISKHADLQHTTQLCFTSIKQTPQSAPLRNMHGSRQIIYHPPPKDMRLLKQYRPSFRAQRSILQLRTFLYQITPINIAKRPRRKFSNVQNISVHSE